MSAAEVLEYQSDFTTTQKLRGFSRGRSSHYDPEIGRFVSKDPTLFFGGGGLNLYGYAFNDPVNFMDQNGKNPVLVGAVLGVGLFVGFVNAIGAYRQPGTTLSDIGQSFGAGFITGAVSVTIGILTGGVGAAGGLGTALTASGAIAGIAADLGLTALFAPYTLPSGTNVGNIANGISAISNNPTCPTQ